MTVAWYVMGAYFMVCAIGSAPPDPDRPGALLLNMVASLGAFALAAWWE